MYALLGTCFLTCPSYSNSSATSLCKSQDIPQDVKIYPRMSRFTSGCQDIPQDVKIYLRGKIYLRMSRYTSGARYTSGCQDIPQDVKIYLRIPLYFRSHQAACLMVAHTCQLVKYFIYKMFKELSYIYCLQYACSHILCNCMKFSQCLHSPSMS